MKKSCVVLILCVSCLLVACSPVKSIVSNQYKLDAFSVKKMGAKKPQQSLLISQPDAIAGYQTEQMLYTDKPFALNAFANSAWISSPANMLYPLITQSLQNSHYFFAVATGPNADKTDYRLDTQLIALQQNFMIKPSVLELTVQVVLTHINDNRIVASTIFKQRVGCTTDTPYGGVIAANKAAHDFTLALTKFVVERVARDSEREISSH